MILHLSVNWLAVVLATAAAFVFGAAWYIGLSKQWFSALGRTKEDLNVGYTPFIWTLLAELIMAYLLAILIPAAMGETTLVNGMLLGALLWFGFVLTSVIMIQRYEGMKWSLTVIDAGHILGVLLIEGAVIGAFG